MAAKLRAVSTPAEEGRKQRQAFAEWLTSAETEYLECRDGRHLFPGLTDPTTDIDVRQGVCYVEATCPRCGVAQHKLIGVKDGYLVGSGHTKYDYSGAPGYLLPPEACDGAAMSRDRRAETRLELVERAMSARGRTLAGNPKRKRSS